MMVDARESRIAVVPSVDVQGLHGHPPSSTATTTRCCCFTSNSCSFLWSDRIERLICEAETAGDDSRWSRWFWNGGTISKTKVARFRMCAAAFLLLVCAVELAASIYVDGLEGIRLAFSFLTVWGINFNMVYFASQSWYYLHWPSCRSPSGMLRWIVFVAQCAFIVEVLVMILYFLLIFTTDLHYHMQRPSFWFEPKFGLTLN